MMQTDRPQKTEQHNVIVATDRGVFAYLIDGLYTSVIAVIESKHQFDKITKLTISSKAVVH